MAKAARKKTPVAPMIEFSRSRDIPFNRITLSQSNVRQTDVEDGLDDLTHDIDRREDLVMGLNVRAVLDAEGAETGDFETPAGGRRYRAIARLVEAGRFPADGLVPCLVKKADAKTSAIDDSLAENVVRLALHPLDQFKAFKRMVDDGMSKEEVADAYRTTPRYIAQRLRLAHVAPSLLDAYARGAMTLAMLETFTVNPSHARQEQVWEAIQRSHSRQTWHIRDLLTETTVPTDDKRALFVGVATYEQAGGVMLRDLFADEEDGWLENPELLDQLVADKLKAAAEEIAAEGWKWIEVDTDLPYGHARLAPGGRLVAITGANFGPENPAWTAAFARLQERGRLVFSAAIDGSVYAKHGTTVATRLTVIDKVPADDAAVFPASPGIAPDVATLIAWVVAHVPARPAVDAVALIPAAATAPRSVRAYLGRPLKRTPAAVAVEPEGVALDYEIANVPGEAEDGSRISDAIYEQYGLQALRIAGSQPHPTKLVQSAAMASVAPPKPSYRPQLPANIRDLLSDAQLETLIYAGEAHSDHLAGSWMVEETFDLVTAARDDAEAAVRFRRGFFIGDGTGVGKGRQSAAIILDNWLQGRRKAVWISKSDKLLEDAQRDWSALGMERLLVTPLSRFPQGRSITLDEGVLFTTYSTLRSDDRGEKVSRVKQIVEWLGSDFDGAIIFDEAHAMQNAAGGKGERGDVAASQQGRAGLRLQHALPEARITYVSATGATTVHNLAYAQRLGLWGGEDFPFSTRGEFVEAIEAGGVAAMEVLARDLRALGLYTARSLSFDGVEYELVEHALTPEQTRIYDAYAGAFVVIHNNLDAAMEAANITGTSGTLNRQAKSAARSAFESAKQRFFGHLLTSMKTPTLIRSITSDLEAGHAAVIQIVSTGEALMERRLAELPTEEWNDVRVDITPREYV